VSPVTSGSVNAQSLVVSYGHAPHSSGPAEPEFRAGTPGQGIGGGERMGGGAMARMPRTAGDIQAAAAGSRLGAGIMPLGIVGEIGVGVRVGGSVFVGVGVGVNVGVNVNVGVLVGVEVLVAVFVGVDVDVAVDVTV